MKFVNFEDVYNVEKTALDIWAGEADIKMLKTKEKFLVHTRDRTFEFYARNAKERDIWM